MSAGDVLSDDVFGKILSFLSLTELCWVSEVSKDGLIGQSATNKRHIWKNLIHRDFRYFEGEAKSDEDMGMKECYFHALDECVKIFNNDPIKWSKQFAGDVEEDVLTRMKARVLFTCCRRQASIDKKLLGVFFARPNGFGHDVFGQFMRFLDLSDVPLFWALRIVLSLFRLPGEAQYIDKLLGKFAEVHYESFPDHYSNQDSVYILCYSLIMLGTDLHSVNVRKKLKFNHFTRHIAGIDNGADFPLPILKDFYKNTTNVAPIIGFPITSAQGFLKCGRKKQFYNVEGGLFCHYESDDAYFNKCEPISKIELSAESCSVDIVVPISERKQSRFNFTDQTSFILTHYGKRTTFKARELYHLNLFLSAVTWNMLPNHVRERFRPFYRLQRDTNFSREK